MNASQCPGALRRRSPRSRLAARSNAATNGGSTLDLHSPSRPAVDVLRRCIRTRPVLPLAARHAGSSPEAGEDRVMSAAYLRGPQIQGGAGSTYQSGCSGKIPMSRAQARLVLRKRGGGRCYRCCGCGSWHTTSRCSPFPIPRYAFTAVEALIIKPRGE